MKLPFSSPLKLVVVLITMTPTLFFSSCAPKSRAQSDARSSAPEAVVLLPSDWPGGEQYTKPLALLLTGKGFEAASRCRQLLAERGETSEGAAWLRAMEGLSWLVEGDEPKARIVFKTLSENLPKNAPSDPDKLQFFRTLGELASTEESPLAFPDEFQRGPYQPLGFLIVGLKEWEHGRSTGTVFLDTFERISSSQMDRWVAGLKPIAHARLKLPEALRTAGIRALGTGLSAVFFSCDTTKDAMSFHGQEIPAANPFTEIDSQAQPPPSNIQRDHPFAAKLTGMLDAPAPGEYRFQVIHDDGVRIWIDEKSIMDAWWTGGTPSERPDLSKPIRLERGLHKLRIEYFQDKGPAYLQLRWNRPGMEPDNWEPLPSQVLYPAQK